MTTTEIRNALAARGIISKSNNKPFLAKKLEALLAVEEAARIAAEAKRIADEAAAQPRSTKQHDSDIPPVGTKLTHNYRDGRICTATVLADGLFEYNGRTYDNLGAIAKEDSGLIWNGKMFFRLVPYPKHGANPRLRTVITQTAQAVAQAMAAQAMAA